MKKFTIYSKITFLLLVLTSLNACKKSETVAAASTGCKISKIDYGDGTVDNFIFNSTGQVAEYYQEYLDNGKKVRGASSLFTYDANGLVIANKYSDNSGQEKYTYTNGALSTIEAFDDKNVSVYKITVTTDANKRVIGMKDSNNYTSKITRDTQGNYSKSETYDDKNNLLVREERANYDSNKNWRNAITGWSVDLTLSYLSYIYYGGSFNEPSGNPSDYKLSLALDDSGNYTGKLVTTYSGTSTYQYNSNGFPTQLVYKDVIATTNNNSRTYAYSDCQ